jgi:hypothetical protein
MIGFSRESGSQCRVLYFGISFQDQNFLGASGTTGVLILPGASGSKIQPSEELDGDSRASQALR